MVMINKCFIGIILCFLLLPSISGMVLEDVTTNPHLSLDYYIHGDDGTEIWLNDYQPIDDFGEHFSGRLLTSYFPPFSMSISPPSSSNHRSMTRLFESQSQDNVIAVSQEIVFNPSDITTGASEFLIISPYGVNIKQDVSENMVEQVRKIFEKDVYISLLIEVDDDVIYASEYSYIILYLEDTISGREFTIITSLNSFNNVKNILESNPNYILKNVRFIFECSGFFYSKIPYNFIFVASGNERLELFMTSERIFGQQDMTLHNNVLLEVTQTNRTYSGFQFQFNISLEDEGLSYPNTQLHAPIMFTKSLSQGLTNIPIHLSAHQGVSFFTSILEPMTVMTDNLLVEIPCFSTNNELFFYTVDYKANHSNIPEVNKGLSNFQIQGVLFSDDIDEFNPLVEVTIYNPHDFPIEIIILISDVFDSTYFFRAENKYDFSTIPPTIKTFYPTQRTIIKNVVGYVMPYVHIDLEVEDWEWVFNNENRMTLLADTFQKIPVFESQRLTVQSLIIVTIFGDEEVIENSNYLPENYIPIYLNMVASQNPENDVTLKITNTGLVNNIFGWYYNLKINVIRIISLLSMILSMIILFIILKWVRIAVQKSSMFRKIGVELKKDYHRREP